MDKNFEFSIVDPIDPRFIPEPSALKNVESDPMGKSTKSFDELVVEAAAYRAKAAATSDLVLAEGYRALAKETEAELVKYSPDQERDERGRFGSGSSGSSTFRDTRGSVATGKEVSQDQMEKFAHGSAAPYIVSDGKGGYRFTAERQALHDKIVAEALKGVPKSENPTIHMLGGGPASGKSTMLDNGKLEEIPSKESGLAVQINADDIKEQLPGYLDRTDAFDKRAAADYHEESSYIAKEIQAQAYAGGHDIVLDGTGNSSIESLQGKIDAAHENGYQVVGNYATLPTELAVKNQEARFLNTGRYVPNEVVREIHASVSSVFPQAASNFDRVNLWDNTVKGQSVLVASGSLGQPLSVVDPGLYQTFLDKAKG